MRVWEIDGSNASINAGLVLEQDFILRVRRMQRLGTAGLVLNFVLNAVANLAHTPDAMKAVQQKLQECATLTKGTFSPMSNGDVFIAWDQVEDAQTHAARIVQSILPEHTADAAKFLLLYHMPKDYAALRERANHYVELSRAAATVGDGAIEAASAARGPLTAKNLDQIERMLDEVNLRHYMRTQPIYDYADKIWRAVGEECFIGFGDLRRERFPKLELDTTEHFFLALCGIVDQRLLAMLTAKYELIGGRTLNLNLSMAAIMGTVFAQFVRRVPLAQRPLIGFELSRGDLLQDFSTTLSTIQMLKREGFRVALDNITPDMVRYIDFAAFAVDNFKINVSKDRAVQLFDRAIRASLAKIPADKMIFYRCDNEGALATGLDLGVTRFQGWLIDDLATKKAAVKE